MPQDSDAEKTEAATPRKLEQAREEGKVPQSRELSTFALLMAAVLCFAMIGSYFVQSVIRVIRGSLTLDAQVAFDISQITIRLGGVAQEMLLLLLSLIGIMWLVALATPMALSGINLSTKGLMPDFSRLNPISGFGRMFSLNSLIELIKSILKSLVIGGIAIWLIIRELDEFMSLSVQPLERAVQMAGSLILFCFFVIGGSTILLVILDVPFQLWNYHKQLRMTKEEVKREMKESDGDPMVKGRIRRLQQEAARKRMMAEVPDASVVVTNPQHYAVALKYDPDSMRAPKVVAKGIGLIAARIREIAEEHRIPIFEAPPLARALYRHADLEAEIPGPLYSAVAEILAYLYQLKLSKKEGIPPPRRPSKLKVPQEMDPANRPEMRRSETETVSESL